MAATDPAGSPPARRTVGGGAAVTTTAALLTSAFGGVLGVVVARILGPVDMGAYTLAGTTLFVLVTLTTLGVQAGTTYFAAGRGWPAEEAFPQLQLSSLGIGLLGAVAGLAVVLLTRNSLFRDIEVTDLLPALIALPFALSWTFTGALALA